MTAYFRLILYFVTFNVRISDEVDSVSLMISLIVRKVKFPVVECFLKSE